MAGNSRTIYQLWAEGSSINGWRFTSKSKAVFARKEDAEAYAREFRELCMDKERFFDAALDDDLFRIRVVEFDLYE